MNVDQLPTFHMIELRGRHYLHLVPCVTDDLLPQREIAPPRAPLSLFGWGKR